MNDQFDDLLTHIDAGQTVFITRGGADYMRLVPLEDVAAESEDGRDG